MAHDRTPHYERRLSIAELLRDSPKLKRMGVTDGPASLALRKVWDAAVGEAVAANAVPLGLKAGTLTVAVRSPGWMQQLTLLKPKLLANLREAAGDAAVADLRFTLSDFPMGH